MRVPALGLAVLAAALAAGCGRAPATSACRAQAGELLRDASRVLVYNGATAPSPADLALFGLGDDLAAFQRAGCEPEIAGGVLAARLGRRGVEELLSHLTAPMTRYVRLALACAERRERSAACGAGASRPAAVLRPPTGNPFTP